MLTDWQGLTELMQLAQGHTGNPGPVASPQSSSHFVPEELGGGGDVGTKATGASQGAGTLVCLHRQSLGVPTRASLPH